MILKLIIDNNSDEVDDAKIEGGDDAAAAEGYDSEKDEVANDDSAGSNDDSAGSNDDSAGSPPCL